MTDEEFEFILFDRIEKIKQINKEYDLENNAYIAFSGGKDSTVLHYLIDLALPNNKIPRVFSNTGIEYIDIVKFVKRLAEQDSRIIILNQTRNIKKTLEEYGYPFKSKEHANKVDQYKRLGLDAKEVKNYLDKNRKQPNGKPSRYICPKILRYQFTDKFKLKVSNKCCEELKKDIMKKWNKEAKKTVLITGMLAEEAGARSTKAKCVSFSGNVMHFNPMLVVTKKFENWFIENKKIKLCKLYYPPYNFERTGCKGCPFSLNLQEQLDVMERLLPNEKKQCEILWKPVYDEYRRIGYRLRKKSNQLTIFDFID